MKYNPITQELYTDTGTFLKQLHCPLAKKWEQLDLASIAQAKTCSTCNRAVYETSNLSDNDLQTMLQNASETCLKLDFNQPNLTIKYENRKQQ